MFRNASDYRCQDDIFTAATNGRLGSSSILSSSQLESQPYFTILGQQMQHQQQSARHQQVQVLRNSVQLNQKSLRMNSLSDCNEESLNGDARNDSKDRLIAASTQTQYYENQTINNCDTITALSSAVTIDSEGAATTVAPGHMMYTVHRVVTTSQIQTALGNTYASSSSVSSVVSALRNENDNLTTPTSISTSLTTIPGNGIVGIPGNVLSKMDENSNTSNSVLISAAGISDSQQSEDVLEGVLTNGARKLNTGSDHSRFQSASCRNSIIMNSVNGSKSALIPRILQNVIPTCVYLMSRIAVHMEIEGTSQCPTQVMLAAALGCEELGIANKLLAQSIFGLWMTSGLLDIQLKSHHRPYAVRVVWQSLLDKFSSGNAIEKQCDDPMIMLKRNVFFSKRDEEKIKDQRILELLYEEAKYNVLSGRYVMESSHALMLGGIQAKIELGPYNSHTHTICFLRENQLRFLPKHVARNSSWAWLPVSRKNSAEVKLLEQFKRVPLTATTKKLMRKYLEFCWALPFYGAAFFHGQMEQPVRGLMSLVSHKDVRVLIAVNERGIFIIDPLECTLLIGLRYEDMSWDFAKPSVNNDPDCQTCIFIEFDAMENGIQVSKLMQIFSKQASMIDALISHFIEQIGKLKVNGNTCDKYQSEPYPIPNNGNGVLCNKLWRLTLATFDEEGRCIGQTGNSLTAPSKATMDLSAYQQLDIRMSTRGKRPLRNLTPNDKVRAIQRIHQGETKASVSRDIGVPESTLRGWCKNEHKLRFMCRQINETNEIEQFSIYKSENFQPSVKRNKLDKRNPFTSTINIENLIEYNGMSNLNNFDFNINDNINYENALLEKTLSEFLKNKPLPDSNEIMKHNVMIIDNQTSSRLCSLGKTLSSISASNNYEEYLFSPYNLNYYSKLNSNFMPILLTSSISAKSSVVSSSFEDPSNERKRAIIYDKRTNILSQCTNNTIIKTNDYNTEKNDCKMFGANNKGDTNNNKKNVDDIIYNQCNNESRLLHWCKHFNASLNFLALAATAATLQPTPVHVQVSCGDTTSNIKSTKIPNMQSYYESEPEDLSIHSIVSKTSTSINSHSQS